MLSYFTRKKNEILEERVHGRYFYPRKSLINTIQMLGGIFSLTFGIISLITYSKMFEIRMKYDNSINRLYFNIDRKIDTLYFYIQLRNYNQNSLLYYKSISYDQLKGKKSVEGCDPLERMGGKDIYPCGILANTFFQDRFDLYKRIKKGDKYILEEVKIGTDDITSNANRDRVKDTEYKIDEIVAPPLWEDYEKIPDLKNNNRFINWISIAGYSTFRKLYGKIKNLEKGEYVLKIDPSFQGEKAVYFAESGYLGLKNYFLGCLLVVIGVLSITSLFFV
ncbi:CDC50-like protein [Spraguea lophii 42_110]|uniref:CDC50-like protein n=1 Tax=Spraguea lophii (strain 42_110) TaxID=1358809 RepID=S7W8B1_SPRLO|nr:CDC50-like protein [Spraguea lophii 42_110]